MNKEFSFHKKKKVSIPAKNLGSKIRRGGRPAPMQSSMQSPIRQHKRMAMGG